MIRPVQIIHEGAENGGIGHLAADDPGLHHGAAQETGHFFLQLDLHPFDEVRSLVIKNVRLPQELIVPVLRVAG